MTEISKIPKIGKYYHFFDDGKLSPSRHYICRVERIITPEEAKSIMCEVPNEYDDIMDAILLYDHWHDNEMPNHDWLYAKDTDYFIECSCPKYDKHNLWFVRTKDGGWFSMDIQSWWQGGRLDIDESIYESILNDIENDPYYSMEAKEELLELYKIEQY